MKDVFARHRVCAMLAISFGMFVMTPVLYMATDASPCSQVSNAYFVPSSARPGEVVTLHWETTEDRACGGEIIRRLISLDGGQSLTYTFGVEQVLPRSPIKTGRHIFEKQMAVPSVAPGNYEYAPLAKRWRSTVQWFRQMIVPTYEVPVRVPLTVLPLDLTSLPRDRLVQRLR